MYLLELFAKLPLWILYGVADIIRFLAYYVIRYRRDVVEKNLRLSFPDKTEKEREQIAKNFYRNLADIAVESLKLLSISKKDLQKRIRITNQEIATNYLKKGQSIVVMTSHLGNWEWLLAGNGVTLGFDVDAVYKELTTASFDQLMLKIRSRFGPHPVEMRQVARELVKRKNITRIIAMVADQTPFPEQAYWTTFLHQDTPFFTGVAGIAKRTNYPVLYTGMRRVKRGYYETWFEVISEDLSETTSEQLIEDYVRKVERDIQLYPDQWLWSHARWKYKRPALTKKEQI
ncbi:lysophospholipid acyltransferase family protein [Xanthocytophaga agilis]|uniref:Lysophospholipid acyltransferase family protein n=1 Tax=Xanthocytophaga agilis TaxID=3048010 RepID=A0AAE3QYY1_9BACT|nr:lysophospholipid acyltransferase family protein [Xanthocytophaga agilis]MDJ1500609.1 lysophospholipid acyltransferase family protein [Xanthocytophaga agilis]